MCIRDSVARVADRPEQRVERLGVDGRVDRPHGGGNECCSGCDQTFNAGPSHGRSWVGGGPEQWGAKRRNAKAQHGDDRVGSAVPSPSRNRRRRRSGGPVSYTHLRAHETVLDLVCPLLLEKKNKAHTQ